MNSVRKALQQSTVRVFSLSFVFAEEVKNSFPYDKFVHVNK